MVSLAPLSVNHCLIHKPQAHGGHNAGFTLIELSVVLIIIGLIAGGLLSGQELIVQAEIRKTVSQVEKMDAAINAFRLKYDCLPGDCSDVAQLGFDSSIIITASNDDHSLPANFNFGLISSAYANNFSPDISVHSTTGGGEVGVHFNRGPIHFVTNGDGNGMINAGFTQEFFVAMYELSSVGMLGNVDPVTYTVPLSVNAWSPVTANRAFWAIANYNGINGNTSAHGHYYAAITDVGSGDDNAPMYGNAVLAPKIAQSMDSKIDDGSPRTGKMLATTQDEVSVRTLPFGFTDPGDVGVVADDSPYCVTSAPYLYNVVSTKGRCAIMIHSGI